MALSEKNSVSAPAAPSYRSRAPVAQQSSGVLLAIFLVSLLIPVLPEIFSLRMDPYRFVLIFLFVPFVFQLLSGQVGRITILDVTLFLYVMWTLLVLLIHHGAEKIPFALAGTIEIYGGYLAGRLLIRGPQDYRRFMKIYFVLLMILAPFAIYELFTFRMPISEFFGQFLPASPKNLKSERFGLSRAQVVFTHAILFGLFCSIAVANVYYLNRNRPGKMLTHLFLVIGVTFTCLSSGPFLSVGAQIGMVLWGKITKNRWQLLLGLVVASYVIIEILSNRGPIIILIETITFDPWTGWTRVYVWRYGMASVMNNPILGVGLNGWPKPYWLTTSVDNFWLLTTIRYGIPSFILLVSGLAVHVWRIIKVKNLSTDENNVRTGYIISLIGTFLTLATVHAWEAIAVFIMFYIGAGSFLYTTERTDESQTADERTAAATKASGRTGPTRISKHPPLRYSRAPTGRARKEKIK